MYILSLGNISKKEWAVREKSYARHLRRIKDRFDPDFFSWFEHNKLHDAKLIKICLDDSVHEISFYFDYYDDSRVEETNKLGRRKTRRVVFIFSGVVDFSITAIDKKPISLARSDFRTDFLAGELNTHPYLKKHKKMNSIVMSMVSKSEFEILVLFEAAKFREGK